MLIAGIGSSIEFRNVRHGLYHEIHWVSAEVAERERSPLPGPRPLRGPQLGAAYAVAGEVLRRRPARPRPGAGVS
ncbi:hypothetical protein QJS66_06955 [Kocuria rhizophila]|nr:hypothetical protein QJS66_06955 [Kocuria rhizophila]